MTSKLDHALALAADGFFVFPIRLNGKKPAHKGWQQEATRDPAQLREWFTDGAFNLGVFTGRFGDGESLVCVDVDNKGDKRGDDVIFALELEGFDLPDTREVATPSGGRHLYFRVPDALRQGANVLGPGIDIRSRGGFVLGDGSTIEGRAYELCSHRPIAPAPDWLVARCGRARDRSPEPRVDEAVQVDTARALLRAAAYLRDDAPLAAEGSAGDTTTYRVAARIKDFGCDQADALGLLLEHWNPRCLPPWATDELAEKVRNAYAYGLETPGAAAPEAQFTPVEVPPAAPEETEPVGDPVEDLNRKHAFVIAGNSEAILFETTDYEGNFELKHLAVRTFHLKYASSPKISFGKKSVPKTELWLEWKGRRSYDGLVFSPGQPVSDRFYNLWRGFAVETWQPGVAPPAGAQLAHDRFLEHLQENICRGNVTHYQWLMSWFANMVQKPWDKSGVAVVLQGAKGVGKNVAVETIGSLFGRHYTLVADPRYLTGNFNSHLEHCLLLALDEAFWSGDKKAEGAIKNLITGARHQIERKGAEPYRAPNRTNVVIMGNEDWLVPASHDERRFAVFNVGSGRKQDDAFFGSIIEGMAAGGNRLLLSTLAGFDAGETRKPINTSALLDQKIASLPLVQKWWLQCLEEGRLVNSDFGTDWQEEVPRDRLRESIARYAKELGRARYLPDASMVGKELRKCCPDIGDGRKGNGTYVYKVPVLAAARAAWDQFMGQSAAGAWAAGD